MREISGYVPKTKPPAERLEDYKKEIEKLESMIEIKRRLIKIAEKELAKREEG
jgi:hypothetical protein